jgi:hypothetical protein
MKKNDIIYVLVMAAITLIFVLPGSRAVFEAATREMPYLMGFVKTAILASLGELLADRIVTKKYFARPGIALRFLVWGVLGMGFVLMFQVFALGVAGAMEAGYLPFLSATTVAGRILGAFFTSLIMNLIFAPTFMMLHRITDQYIELSGGCWRNLGRVKLAEVVDRIDWKRFIGFVVLQSIPIFWIPAHTITFLLPAEYRVLMAGYLSIALGLILTLSRRTRNPINNIVEQINDSLKDCVRYDNIVDGPTFINDMKIKVGKKQ